VWIDLDRWPRRPHYVFFRAMARPYAGFTAEVDVTGARQWCRSEDVSFFLASWWALLRSCDEVPAMRQRIRGDGVWQHDRVCVASTALAPDGTFRFCLLDHAASFDVFAREGRQSVQAAIAAPAVLADPVGRDDVVFGTVIPWRRITSVQHARGDEPDDSVPRIAFGRASSEGSAVRMAVSVEAHHALVDGAHIAALLDAFEQRMNDLPGVFR
jgi:chloramphenicol O-acetyltransferase type A